MGVPKFYRWISERYPCLSEVVKEYQLPEFDNLYLDMNGIIHVCSHPEDDNPHFRITEEQIFRDICHYIEFLFRMIKPRKVFFMAIDGVAPRAKMNQQRGRRFRSAREAEELIKRAQEKGEVLPTEKRFDSNCITPGTVFMKRLQDHLKYFVVSKVTQDPLWQGPKIILSGHETPGEGEHKVMDFIRYSRSQPGHDPNTRHCLYGLDADLIMLGLTSHEPHFALLREEVRFGGRKDKNKRPATPEDTTFHLLHLSLLREYLDYEFSSLKTKLPFGYNLENIIDDWILMGFLVGNDFVPHLPHLHIHHDALPLLWKTYINVLPTLDGFLNEGGHLNLHRFEKFVGCLAEFDRSQFNEQFVDMKYLEGKRSDAAHDKGAPTSGKEQNGPDRKQKKRDGGENAFAALEGLVDMDLEYNENGEENGHLEAHLASGGICDSDIDSDDDFDTFDAEFSAHKRDYYMTKLEYENVTPEVLRDQAYEYVRAIQWILLYYYEGVQSWSWFYPHHYAPYISDVRDFRDMTIAFEMSEPFKPFEQLMAVLPAPSKELLPVPFQELMTCESSPVRDYYPVQFRTDLNGKQQDWEAVVLIPFIDEKRLLEAMRSKESSLTAEERHRNSHGPCYMYQFSPEQQGTYPSSMPGVFPDVAASQAKICDIPKFQFCLEPHRIVKGLMKGTKLDVYFPGFPTLKHIPHEHRLEKCGVKVFQMNSRGYNMMLTIKDIPEKSLEEVATDLLGQTVWIGWPHFHEAKVYGVTDEKFRITVQEVRKKDQTSHPVQWKKEKVNGPELDILYKEASTIRENYYTRFGVEVGKTTILIYAGTMTGRRYVHTSKGKITAEKQFSLRRAPFALQTTCKDILIEASDDMHFRTTDELFPPGATVFMLGNPHYGCQGEVLEVDNKDGRIRVSFKVLQEPDLSHVLRNEVFEQQQYVPSYIAAQQLGLSNNLLARITGTVLILRRDGGNTEAKANIGLNLKFTKRGEEVPGYTKKTEDGWLYSQACLDAINQYLTEFAELWDYIASSQTGNSDIYTEAELFPEFSPNAPSSLTRVQCSTWLVGLNGGSLETHLSQLKCSLQIIEVTTGPCQKKLKDVLQYLEKLPCSQIRSVKIGGDIVGDATVLAIERIIDDIVAENKKRQRKVKMQVRPHLLFRPLPNQGSLEPDPGTTFELLDRVVAVKVGYSVPFGLRGTIIGIHPEENPMNTMYDVMFDQEFPSGIAIRGSAKRCYIVPAFAMLNLKCSAQQKHPHQQQQQQQPLTPQWKISSQPFQCQQYQQGQGQNSYTSLLNARDERFTHTSLLNPRDERFTHTPLHQRDERFTPGRKSMWTKKPDPQPAYNNHDFCPQFVMPKFASSSPSASRKTSASVPNLPADDSDFTNIWNQLRKSNTTAGTNNRQIPQHYAGHRTDIGNQKMPGNKKDTRSIESPVFDIASLQVAAEKLGKISPPSGDLMEVKHPDNPPTGILVDLSDSNTVESAAVGESTTWSFGAHTASSSVQEHNVGTTDVSIDAIVKQSQTKTQVTQSSHNQKKPSVLALFESASRARETHSNSLSQSEQSNPVHVAYSQQQTLTPMVTDPVKATGDISAHLAALHIPKCTSPSTLVTGTQPTAALQESAGLQSATLPQRSQEDGSAALKQMLKIGLEEAASVEPINKKFYGKQVSVQELFDVAKQAPPLPKVETKSEAKPVQQPQQLQQHTQQHLHQQPPQQQQYLQRPAVKVVPGLLPFRPLMNMSGMQGRSKVRNHVEELAELCQASGLLQPKYDFNYQRQRGFTSLVTLPSGARFEGSLSSSQEEAAESAAGMALLCLQQTQVRFAGGFGAPWLQQPGFGMGVLHPRQRLTSPNSAFSPVTNPLMIFSQPPPNLPGQRARQPLISCPPPVIPNSSCQLPSSSRAPAPFSHFTQPSSSQSQSAYSDPNSHSATSEAWQRLSHQNTPDHEHEKGKDHQLPTRSSTEAFIPLQVTVKQRRREELSEQHPVTLSTVTNNSQNKMTASCSPREEKVSTCDLQVTDSKGSMKSYCQAVICSDATISTATCSSSQSGVNERKLASACKEDETATDRDHASAGSGKKRRSRIVANFGADSSK